MTHVTIYEFFFASTLDLPDLISKSSLEMNLTPSFILVAGLSDLSLESTKTKNVWRFCFISFEESSAKTSTINFFIN